MHLMHLFHASSSFLCNGSQVSRCFEAIRLNHDSAHSSGEIALDYSVLHAMNALKSSSESNGQWMVQALLGLGEVFPPHHTDGSDESPLHMTQQSPWAWIAVEEVDVCLFMCLLLEMCRSSLAGRGTIFLAWFGRASFSSSAQSPQDFNIANFFDSQVCTSLTGASQKLICNDVSASHVFLPAIVILTAVHHSMPIHGGFWPVRQSCTRIVHAENPKTHLKLVICKFQNWCIVSLWSSTLKKI